MSTPVDPRSWVGRKPHKSLMRERFNYRVDKMLTNGTHLLNNVNTGYCIRLAMSVSVLSVACYVLYRSVLIKREECKPLAKRWRWCSPKVEITFLEKRPLENSEFVIYRFALPHSYDYAGYSPVSSVELMTPEPWWIHKVCRWYTPISHPEERGIIEFAINMKSGKMSKILTKLNRGDVMELGRWMKEFRYRPNSYDEIGLICSTSGASIALQLMNFITHNKSDKTKLKVLYCHDDLDTLAMKYNYFDKYVEESKEQINVKYNIMNASPAALQHSEHEWKLNDNIFLGYLTREIIAATMPAPTTLACNKKEVNSFTDGKQQLEPHQRSSLLICGPRSMLWALCGKTRQWFNQTYSQNKLFFYFGIIPDMGYSRHEIYKFGNSIIRVRE